MKRLSSKTEQQVERLDFDHVCFSICGKGLLEAESTPEFVCEGHFHARLLLQGAATRGRLRFGFVRNLLMLLGFDLGGLKRLRHTMFCIASETLMRCVQVSGRRI